ncbi:MAG: hypothetical protein LBL42_02910 [Tannerella sp.]|jgi:hypothetical protein|nr:hypothetical protein [Tannerella sp.]
MAKKKVSPLAHQKLQAAHRKKAYMQKLRYFCTLIGGESLYDELPGKILEMIYCVRGGPFKIRVKEGEKITRRFVRIMYTYLDEAMKEYTLDLYPDGDTKVTLSDYYQYIYPMEIMSMVVGLSFNGRDKLAVLREHADRRYADYLYQTATIITAVCATLCDLNKRSLYTFVYEKIVNTDRLPKNMEKLKYQLLTIGTHPLDVRYVKLDGDWRPVCQAGEIAHDMGECYFLPTDVLLQRLEIPGAGPDETAPVYIQQHAINRIIQRAYCAYPSIALLVVSRSFLRKRRIIPTGKNQYLIECFYEDIKIGYFVATYVDGILVIRTFLLLTQSGTPESRRLEELTGLQKKDIAYLAMDDLRTLANSDIIDDGEVRDIFIKAGCESILELCRRVKEGRESALSLSGTSRELSKLILEYIQLGAKDEEYFVNDEN